MLWYVATPYSKYELGLEVAWADACQIMARLVRNGHEVYSPIVHTHPIARYGNIDPLDHKFWLAFDRTMMDKADGLLVVTMPGWSESKGIEMEIEHFESVNKPIKYVNHKTGAFI